MSAYSKGANFERRVRGYLQEIGFVVFRSAGSHTPADLIALKAGEVLLVQCKLDGKISPTERYALSVLGDELQCRVMLAWREGRELKLEEVKDEPNRGE